MKIGVELEMADVPILDVVEEVYEFDGRNPATWQDRWGAESKPVYDHRYWNVVSDSSIRSKDGCRPLMLGHKSDGSVGKASGKKTAPRNWCGAELMSPATQNQPQLIHEMSALIHRVYDKGATFRPEQWCGFHVHVDISDKTFEEMKEILFRAFVLQTDLQKLKSTRKHPAKYKMHLLSQKEMEMLESAETKAEFYELWRTGPDGKVRGIHSPIVRRLFDVSSYLAEVSDKKTIEFRCFRSHHDIDFLEGCIDIAKDIVAGEKDLDVIRKEIDTLSKLGDERD